MVKCCIVFGVMFSLHAEALVGLQSLESKLFANNQELTSLRKLTESKESLYRAGRSEFYPTLNAIGGWNQNKIDSLTTIEKGSVGYIEGRFNFFNGFKDQANLDFKAADLKLAEIEMEIKTRELRLGLIEVVSDMIGLHKLKTILEEEYQATQTQKQMAAKKVSAGLTGSVDNLEFSLRESEIQIERNRVDQFHREAHQKLVKLFGEELNDAELKQLDFSDVDELIKTSQQFKTENSLAFHKAELALLKSGYEKSEIKSDFFPKLDFTFNVGRLTPSELSPQQYNESKYAVTLTVPLFSGFSTYYKTKSANLQIAAAEKNKIQKSIDAKADFEILSDKMTNLYELFKINESKLIALQKYFDYTLAEYKRGIKNSPDLVGATERLFSSKRKKYEILRELEILKIKLENLQ